MNAIAIWIGKLIGAAISESAPVLLEVMTSAFRMSRLDVKKDADSLDAIRSELERRVQEHRDRLSQANDSSEASTGR